MSELCKWLHEQLARLPLVKYPFDLEDLPENGIYFFYETGEIWGHGGDQPRIVRIGTHRGQGNLRSRMSETYLLDERKLSFGPDNPKPADRSIFRKNLGRALLNGSRDEYLSVWEIDFIPKRNRDQLDHLRDIDRERGVEREISHLLRDQFSFRAVAVDDGAERGRLEKHLIATLANCRICVPSDGWLGRHSPQPKIARGNLWQVQNLKADPLGPRDKEAVIRAVNPTRAWGNE